MEFYFTGVPGLTHKFKVSYSRPDGLISHAQLVIFVTIVTMVRHAHFTTIFEHCIYIFRDLTMLYCQPKSQEGSERATNY